MYNFLDTSAILNGALNLFENVYISPLVMTELEHIKSSTTKSDHVKYLARQAVRDIISSNNFRYSCVSQHKINKLLRKYNFLSDINDHRILCEAIAEAENKEVRFITSDSALYLFAQQIPILQAYYLMDEEDNGYSDYCGWNKYTPTENELVSLYSNPEMNVLHANINEYCKIYEGVELKDVLRWTGERYESLKWSNFKNYFGEKIAPRNLEQKLLFDLLQNQDIKVKLCLGGFGAGKSYCMLQHALRGVKEGRFQKIIFVRNNIITKGSREIGFLSGDLVEKIKPYIMPIADLTSEDYLDELIATGILEPVPLGFMRGRDFSGGTLVFCDEAENLLKENVQLLLGRVGVESEIWFSGDLKQIDHPSFEKNNGINKMIESLKGDPLFGMVKLIKSERSATSQLADRMDT